MTQAHFCETLTIASVEWPGWVGLSRPRSEVIAEAAIGILLPGRGRSSTCTPDPLQSANFLRSGQSTTLRFCGVERQEVAVSDLAKPATHGLDLGRGELPLQSCNG